MKIGNLNHNDERFQHILTSWKDDQENVDWLASLDEEDRDIVVINNFDGQTCNGGFDQYRYNGYAAEEGEYLLEALERAKDMVPLAAEVISLVKAALPVFEVLGEEENKWDDEMDEADYQDLLDKLDKLDTRYYEFNNAFDAQIEMYVRHLDGIETPPEDLASVHTLLNQKPSDETPRFKPRVQLSVGPSTARRKSGSSRRRPSPETSTTSWPSATNGLTFAEIGGST